MIYYANEATALVALPFMLLSFRGFAPHFLRRLRQKRWDEPEFWMTAILLLAEIKSVARMGYWDVWRPFVTGRFDTMGLAGTLFNAAFNTASIAIGVAGLMVLWLTIPPAQRRGWSIFSAPFYPEGLRVWRGLREFCARLRR